MVNELVHLVMPVFNREEFIREAIESVVGQSYPNWVLSVVDDGSTDRTWSIIQEFSSNESRIRAVQHVSNRGIPQALNTGLRDFRGDLFSMVGSDDRLCNDFLESQVSKLREFPSAFAVACDAWIIDSRGIRTGKLLSEMLGPPPESRFGTPMELIRRPHVNSIGILIPEHLLRELSFNERLPFLFDWFCWIQLSLRGRIVYNPRPIVEFRIHAGNVSLGHRRLDRGLSQMASELENLVQPRSRRWCHWIAYYRMRAFESIGDREGCFKQWFRMIAEVPWDHKNLTQLAQLILGEEFNMRIGRALGTRLVRALQ